MFIFKSDIISGAVVCGRDVPRNSDDQIQRCEKNVSFESVHPGITITLAALSFLTQSVIAVIQVYIYTSIDFKENNYLKQKFTPRILLEYLFNFVLVLFSYPQVVTQEIFTFLVFVFIAFQIFEYVHGFPLYNMKISNPNKLSIFRIPLNCLRYSLSPQIIIKKNFSPLPFPNSPGLWERPRNLLRLRESSHDQILHGGDRGQEFHFRYTRFADSR